MPDIFSMIEESDILQLMAKLIAGLCVGKKGKPMEGHLLVPQTPGGYTQGIGEYVVRASQMHVRFPKFTVGVIKDCLTLFLGEGGILQDLDAVLCLLQLISHIRVGK